MNANTLGERISELRKGRGITQEQFAKIMGVSPQAVSKWENDVSCPDISMLPQIADFFHISIDELLKGEQKQETRQVPESERKSLSQLSVKVRVEEKNGNVIRVRVPLTVVKLALELGTSIPLQVNGISGFENLDIQSLITAAENGTIGTLAEVDTESGEHIEVIIE